jgi:hypothetical protein
MTDLETACTDALYMPLSEQAFKQAVNALFVWLISHQPAVLFSQNKPATSNQPAVLFSHNKSAPTISHQPNEQAACLLPRTMSSFGGTRAAVRSTRGRRWWSSSQCAAVDRAGGRTEHGRRRSWALARRRGWGGQRDGSGRRARLQVFG